MAGQSETEIDNEYTTTMEMKYSLELDRNGVIIGGEYDRDSEHPDFIWMTSDRPNLSNLGNDQPSSWTKLMNYLTALSSVVGDTPLLRQCSFVADFACCCGF